MIILFHVNMETEGEIKTALAAARKRRDHLEHIYAHYSRAYERQSRTAWALSLKLRDYPRKLYWKKVTPERWPLDIIQLIPEYCGIAEKLYTRGRLSDRKLIQPRTLSALHIKHMLLSPEVFRYVGELRHWLNINSITVSSERPKWKRYVSRPSLQEMATLFPSPRFMVCGMILTLLGEDGVIEVQVGSACEAIFAKVKHISNLARAHLTIKDDRIIVAYKPARSDVHVLYGGRGKMKRLVKAYKTFDA